MKVEDAIAMLQAIPPGSEVDLQIRRVVTPDSSVRPRRTSADRMRALRARRNGTNDGGSSQLVTSVTNVTVSDASDAAERHGGTQGGSDLDKTEKSGKETGSAGFNLSGKSSARGESDAIGAVTSDASPAVTRKPRRAPTKTALPDGFALTGEHRVYANSKGWPCWWLESRFERFCELAQAKGWVYADWKLAFYGFLRTEVDEYNRGPAQLAHLAAVGGKASTDDAAERRRRAKEAEARVLGGGTP